MPKRITIVDPFEATRRKVLPAGAASEASLVPVFRSGNLVYRPPALGEIRRRVRQQLDSLRPGIKRLVNPHGYPAGLELNLHELKTRLI